MRCYHPICYFALIVLFGCGQESEIKSVIKGVAKNPESVQYRNIAFNENRDLACVEWDAKNSFGSMSGWSTTELAKENGKWVIKILKSPFPECSTNHLQKIEAKLTSIAAGEAEYKKASDEAIQLLAASKNVSADAIKENISDAFPSECKKAHQVYSWGAKHLAVDSLSETERATEIKKIASAKNILQNGTCSLQLPR